MAVNTHAKDASRGNLARVRVTSNQKLQRPTLNHGLHIVGKRHVAKHSGVLPVCSA